MAHRITKPPQPARDITGFEDFTKFMNNKTEKFTKLWGRDTDLQDELSSLISELREDALEEASQFPNPSIDDIHGSMSGTKPTRAAGSDFVRKNDIMLLPEEGLHELGGILGQSIRTLALPLQFLLNFIALAPKPKGGERPITITSILYGLFIRLFSGSLSEWTEGRSNHWDAAVKGSSALSAALARSAQAEIAYNQGKDFAGIFWDSEAFFDSICITKLVQAARRLNFSPMVLYLGLQCHLASRVFKIGNWLSDTVEPLTSIIAGCNLSDKFTKIIFYEVLELAHAQFRGIDFGQFFDDIAQINAVPKGKSFWGFIKSVFLRLNNSKLFDLPSPRANRCWSGPPPGSPDTSSND